MPLIFYESTEIIVHTRTYISLAIKSKLIEYWKHISAVNSSFSWSRQLFMLSSTADWDRALHGASRSTLKIRSYRNLAVDRYHIQWGHGLAYVKTTTENCIEIGGKTVKSSSNHTLKITTYRRRILFSTHWLKNWYYKLKEKLIP